MASKYSGYTRLRDIAVKRAGRLEQAGLSVGISFPTVKQIKEQRLSLDEATARLQMYLEAPTKIREFKKLEEKDKPIFLSDRTGPVVTTEAGRSEAERYLKKERERELHRERNRRYRERVRNLTKNESAALKASKKLGYSVGPSQAQIFAEYLAYRFKYGNENLHYAILNYTEDYKAITKKKQYMTFDELQQDFEKYVLDRKNMKIEYDNMEGISGRKFESMWAEFSGVKVHSRKKRKTKWYAPKHSK